LKRQPNRESGAGARRAVDFDRAVVILDDFFRDVESETGTTLSLLGREIGIEYFAHLRRRNPGASVFDAKIDIKISLGASNFDRTLFLRRRLHGVDKNVLDG